MFTNDTFQGRPKAKHVPVSDQWAENVPKVHTPKKWRPNEYHKTNVMNDYNGKAVATEIVEDVFHSFETEPNRPNPHNARRARDRYYYDFPASWLNAGTVARAVSLRSISVPAKSYFFTMEFELTVGENKPHVIIYLTIPPKYTIEQALSAIAKTVNKVRPKDFGAKMCYGWDMSSNTAMLFAKANDGSAPPANTFKLVAVADGFWELFNVHSDSERANLLTKVNEWIFPNVWDRKDICVHANFVNNSAFHFLGRDGDFFPAPSKIFYQNFTGNDFEIYLTRDGVNPLELPYQDFAIELSFLIDRNHYQE